MKTCPTCSRTYDDDTLSFCLNDGSPLLSGPPDAQVTQRIPAASLTDPYGQSRPYTGQTPPTGPAAVPPPTLQYSAGAWAEPRKRSGSKLWLAVAGIGAVLLLAAGIGVGIILSRGGWFGGKDDEQRSLNTNSEARNSRPTNTPNTTPTPTPTPEARVAEDLGLVGSWSGIQNSNPASLTIVSGEGNTFSGTKIQGVNQVSFVGSIDPKTRRVTLRETKLLKGTPYSNGSGWSLASETGTLSADGQKLSGTGTDEYTRKSPYSWSYKKK